MRTSACALAMLFGLLALGRATATCPDFAAWLRPENEVSTRAARRPPARAPVAAFLTCRAGPVVALACSGHGPRPN